MRSKIENKELTEEDIFSPVSYIPFKGCSSDDMEKGVLISYKEEYARVLYCNSRTIQRTPLASLVWG